MRVSFVYFYCLLLRATHGFLPTVSGRRAGHRSAHHGPSSSSNVCQAKTSLQQLSIFRGGDGGSRTRAFLAGPAAASVLAGSVAGAIGVGVAFPLDTLKTKAQVLGPEASGMLQTMRLIWSTEGLAGFFGGVKGMMVGQAFIKALAFSINTLAISILSQSLPQISQTWILLLAACVAGAITSFAVAPIERVKVMMQASSAYKSEWSCIQAILDAEGVRGLMLRGLGPTLAREIPSYGLYFWSYGLMSQAFDIGPLSPMLFGAIAGMVSWLPVYPIDVVKTLIQNTSGSDGQASAWTVCSKLYEEGGVGAFFDGLTPKLLRAAVNHAVTFTIYDALMHAIMPDIA